MKKFRRIAYFICIALLGIWLFLSNSIIEILINKTPAVSSEGNVYHENRAVYYDLDLIGVTDRFLNTYAINGWVFVETEESNENRFVKLVLVDSKNPNKCYEMDTKLYARQKLVDVFPDKSLPNNMLGILGDFSLLRVENGEYGLYIYCHENEKDYGLVKTKYCITKEKGIIEMTY